MRLTRDAGRRRSIWQERTDPNKGRRIEKPTEGRRGGAPLAADIPAQIVERAQDRCGLVEDPKPRPKTERPRCLVTPQGLRHTAGSIMLAAGVPLIVVSRQLGHANPNLTAQVYAHLLSDAQRDEAAAAFAPPESAATLRGTLREGSAAHETPLASGITDEDWSGS